LLDDEELPCSSGGKPGQNGLRQSGAAIFVK